MNMLNFAAGTARSTSRTSLYVEHAQNVHSLKEMRVRGHMLSLNKWRTLYFTKTADAIQVGACVNLANGNSKRQCDVSSPHLKISKQSLTRESSPVLRHLFDDEHCTHDNIELCSPLHETSSQESTTGELYVDTDERDRGTFGVSDFPCHDEFLQMFRRYVKHDYDDYSPADIEILTKMMAFFPKVAFWLTQEQRLSTWLSVTCCKRKVSTECLCTLDGHH